MKYKNNKMKYIIHPYKLESLDTGWKHKLQI